MQGNFLNSFPTAKIQQQRPEDIPLHKLSAHAIERELDEKRPYCDYIFEFKKEKAPPKWGSPFQMAGSTGLEPATSDVTGRRSNQLS